jgi:hypothetical protein
VDLVVHTHTMDLQAALVGQGVVGQKEDGLVLRQKCWGQLEKEHAGHVQQPVGGGEVTVETSVMELAGQAGSLIYVDILGIVTK